jgi:hypothetical protein
MKPTGPRLLLARAPSRQAVSAGRQGLCRSDDEFPKKQSTSETKTGPVAAASLAFQSMLGLICDPIANRVEAPCLGKNVMAGSNALACANMALADFDALMPLDEVIETAQRVAGQMPCELRCTALGRPNGYPPGRARMRASRRERIQQLKTQGCSHYEMARQLGVSVRAVRKTLPRGQDRSVSRDPIAKHCSKTSWSLLKRCLAATELQ